VKTTVKEFKRSTANRSRIGNLTVFFFLGLAGAFMILPMIYLIMQSLKPMEEIFLFPPRFFVRRPTFNNFFIISFMFEYGWVPFSRYLFNSVIISVSVTAGTVIIGSMAAYPFSKLKFPGKKIIWELIMLALLFYGGVALSFSRYLVMAGLKMINTYWAFVLPALAGTLGIFLMRQFMLSIPDEMLESARLDGASEFRIFLTIAMPQVKPAWLTLVIFAFQGIWNSTGVVGAPGTAGFVYSEELKMLPAALAQLAGGVIGRTGIGNAAILLMTIPPILIFILTQNKVMQTMTHSGIKG
jgi:putative chitobiose transport system permease protein